LPFAQHRDIFLWGRSGRKHFIAISDAPYEHQREMIFLKETNEHIAIWEGELTKERAYEVTGIKTYWLARFRESVIRNDDAL
jgi:Xaa-Pro aminopeptidase